MTIEKHTKAKFKQLTKDMGYRDMQDGLDQVARWFMSLPLSDDERYFFMPSKKLSVNTSVKIDPQVLDDFNQFLAQYGQATGRGLYSAIVLALMSKNKLPHVLNNNIRPFELED